MQEAAKIKVARSCSQEPGLLTPLRQPLDISKGATNERLINSCKETSQPEASQVI